MLSKARILLILLITAALLSCPAFGSAAGGEAFQVKRVGNIHPYDDNAFQVSASEGGLLTITVHDSICIYRTITEQIEAGETTIHWDGCGYNREKLYEKTYTITAELAADSGGVHTVSFASPIEYPLQCLQYALPSSDRLYLDRMKDWFLEYRTVTDGSVRVEIRRDGGQDPVYSYTFKVQGGKIKRKDYPEIAGKQIPEPGQYTVTVCEISRPGEAYEFPLSVEDRAPEKEPVTVTGEIMPDRSMSDEEIWEMMMRPSVVVDIDFFDHQEVYQEPDENSGSLGTLHGQTQGLKVIRIEDKWALIGAWNHEDASYVEGWVPVSRLKTERPDSEYGILIDKRKQTLSVYQKGKKIDTLLVSTGRAEKKHLYQETSAGCFLTGYHRVNFSMNGKKYDYVIQYDGGNLLHQTPYDWGSQKKDFTLGRGYLGAKASHACVRIQPEPGEGGLNAFWLFTHIPYHTRVVILDDPDEREAAVNRLTRGERAEPDVSALHRENEGSGSSEHTVSLTFGGCLVPGGSRAFNAKIDSFVSFVQKNGYSQPFAGLKKIFEEDDMTCVSLGGLIRDGGDAAASEKKYASAPSVMSGIFSGSSIELIQMTDDSLWNAGDGAVAETEAALRSAARIFRRDSSMTVEIKGHLFGFAGCSEKEYLADPGIIDRRIGELKDLQCERIIFLASWGENNASEHSIVQEAITHRSVRAGADLVIGNHRGLLQGIGFAEDVPVVYSTGDLLDGSTSSGSKDPQGILVRAVFNLEPGQESLSGSVIPILPYGSTKKDRNDYCPSADLSAGETENVIRHIWKDTADQFMDRVSFRIPAQ